MTVSSLQRKIGPFIGNGSMTIFPFAFKVFTAADVAVVRADSTGAETTLVLTTDYTVVLNTDQNASPGGTLQLTQPLATNYTLIITSALTPLQLTDLTNQGGFYPSVITAAYDKLTILVQQMQEALGRTLQFSITSASVPTITLPTATGRAGKYLGFDALGNPIAASGTGADAGLRTDIAASGGSGLIGFLQSGFGAILRSLQDKFRDQMSVFDFMTTSQIADVRAGTTLVDVTAAVQAAVNAAGASDKGQVLFFPAGRYMLTAPIIVPRGVTIRGVDPCSKNVGWTGIGGGTWFYINHAGIGFISDSSVGGGTDSYYESLGTYRNQPAPVLGWTPNANDYDFVANNVYDITYRNILCLNATRGFRQYGGGGRCSYLNIRGQFFQTVFSMEQAFDVCRFDQIHVWPFWHDDYNVHTYTMQNLDVIYLLKNDNPMISNVFTIFARAGIRCGTSASGSPSKIHASNCDFDRGQFGIWVDSTSTACTGQFENITHQGETGIAGSKAVFVQGSNATLHFGKVDTEYCWQNGVRVEGSGNVLSFGQLKVVNYNQQPSATFPAVEAYNGNYVTFAVRPFVANGNGGATYAPTGTIIVDEWRAFTPVITSGIGTITTLGAMSGLYKLVGDTVRVEYDVVVTTNGTGAGSLHLAWPLGAPTNNFVGSGKEVALTNKSQSVYAQAGLGFAIISNYDGTYPAADGCRLIGTFQYKTNVGI